VQRNRLLKDMTNDVNTLVLKDNYSQSLCLSLAEKRSRDDVLLFDSHIEYLSEYGSLNPTVEFIPGKKQLLERQKLNEGLTRPELAILLAYTKMGIYRWLLESTLPDEPYFQHYLLDYFPNVLEKRYPEAIHSHPLRREIIATQFTNSVVDLLGITFVQRMVRDTGAAPGEIIRAVLLAFELLDVQGLQQDVFALDNVIPATGQYTVLHELVKAIEGIVGWLLQQHVVSVEAVVTRYREPLATLRTKLGKFLSPKESKRFESSYKSYVKQALPKPLATSVAGFSYLPSSLGVIAVSQTLGESLESTAKVFFELGELLSLGFVRDGLTALTTQSKWEKIALNSLILELRDLQAALTQGYLTIKKQTKDLSVKVFLESKTARRYEETMAEIRRSEALSLASGQVLARLLEQLSRELITSQ
jgi:glutamate dehydrogenase